MYSVRDCTRFAALDMSGGKDEIKIMAEESKVLHEQAGKEADCCRVDLWQHATSLRMNTRLID